MTATIDSTAADALAALRAVIASVLPPAVEIVRGQDNRVPEPAADDYVVLTAMGRVRLSTNVVSYQDAPGDGPRRSRQATELTIQMDVHGPGAEDHAQILSTLLRDGYAVDRLRADAPGVVPLYAGDPRQTPFINGEDQYEDRWSIDVAVQVSPTVTVAQEFAGAVTVTLIPVEPLGSRPAEQAKPPGGL